MRKRVNVKISGAFMSLYFVEYHLMPVSGEFLTSYFYSYAMGIEAKRLGKLKLN